jgi:hypothetical protein
VRTSDWYVGFLWRQESIHSCDCLLIPFGPTLYQIFSGIADLKGGSVNTGAINTDVGAVKCGHWCQGQNVQKYRIVQMARIAIEP